MIEWDEQYALGIESIDAQHRQLITLTGELSDLLTEAIEGQDIYDDMVTLIEKLTAYTVEHFTFEESLMAEVSYESFKDHRAEHKALISQIQKMDLVAIDEDQITHGKNILKFLLGWIFKHISGSDFLYRDVMLAKGIQ